MDASRNGNFTSSKIGDLLSKPTAKAISEGAIFGKPAMTYIRQRNWERKLGRGISTESNARPLTWGKCCEKQVFEQLGIRVKECSQISLKHKTIPYWLGSPDYTRDDDGILTVGDIKCPHTLTSFCQFMDCIPMIEKEGIWGPDPEAQGYEIIAAIREEHDSGEDYYWQLISNAILTGATHAELTIYCPYFSELPQVRQIAQSLIDSGDNAYWWIAKGNDNELPYLLESGRYVNMNKIRWEVSPKDCEILTERVLQAGKLLVSIN